MTTAIERLQPSQLSDQRELLVKDVDLRKLALYLRGEAGFNIAGAIVDGAIERTIEGASTVTLQVFDRDALLLNSGRLGKNVDIKLDGLWFRLVDVDVNEDLSLGLTFEDREVAVLRDYPLPGAPNNGWLAVSVDKTDRVKFAKRLVDEAAATVPIRFVASGVAPTKPIASSRDRPSPAEKVVQRAPGFPKGDKVLIGGVPASPEQRANIARVLDVGLSFNLGSPKTPDGRKLLVISLMVILQESSATNLAPGIDIDGNVMVGLFQQHPTGGRPDGKGTWPGTGDIETDATAFFEVAIARNKANPISDYGWLATDIQRDYTYGTAKHGHDFAKWRGTAEQLVTQYGIPGDRTASDKAVETTNNTKPTFEEAETGAGPDTARMFYRGVPKQPKPGRENNWDCLGRLADNVRWRRFCVSGTVYFMSEPDLFKAEPLMTLTRRHPAVLGISGRYTVGTRNAQVTVRCRIARWYAPPGSIVVLDGLGPLNGRWLVANIRRGIFSAEGTITLKKPRPVLPESKSPEYQRQETSDDNTFTPPTQKGGTSTAGDRTAAGKPCRFIAPLPTAMPTSSHWDYPRIPSTTPDGSGKHAALDWFAPGGTEVVAPIAGMIVEANHSTDASGPVYGGTIKLREQGASTVWVFRHTNPTVLLRRGAKVAQGTTLGVVAPWNDNPSATHSHIEIWKTEDGGYHLNNMLDPFDYIREGLCATSPGSGSPKKGLQKILQDFADAAGTSVGVVVVDLANKETTSVNASTGFPQASLYKLFVVRFLYELRASGGVNFATQLRLGDYLSSSDISVQLAENEADGIGFLYDGDPNPVPTVNTQLAISTMIDRALTYSDNVSGATLLRYARTRPGGSNLAGGSTQVTASAVASLVADIARAAVPSASEIEAIMVGSYSGNRTKIPAGITGADSVGNKTGELHESNYSHDAAIVRDGTAAYVLVVLTHLDPDPKDGPGDKLIAGLAKQVHTRLTG